MFKIPEPKRPRLEENHTDLDEYISSVENVPLIDMKKQVLKLDRSITKNQQLRMKFTDEPLKFIDSETDLAEDLRNCMSFSSCPELYPELVKLDFVKKICSLLIHENIDIRLAVIELVNELLDEDAVSQGSDEINEGMNILVETLIQEQFMIIVFQILPLLDEESTDEKQAVFHILAIVESIVSINPDQCKESLENKSFLEWILMRIRSKTFDSNQQYASEILAILLQSMPLVKNIICEIGGMDSLLIVLSRYKKGDPKHGADEIEFMENLWSCLTVCLESPGSKQLFLKGEGIELMLMMIKEKLMCKMGALRVLSLALLGEEAKENCIHLINISGLKTLFPEFMGNHTEKYKKSYEDYNQAQQDEHCLSIFSSLLHATLTDETNRIRIMVKFCENDFQKLERLIDMIQQYETEISPLNKQIQEQIQRIGDEMNEEIKNEFYLLRIETGNLIVLQLAQLILVYLCCDLNVPDMKDVVLEKINERGIQFDTILKGVEEFARNLGDSKDEENMERDLILNMVEYLNQPVEESADNQN